MSTFEVFIIVLTSGVFLGVLSIFYRLGRAHEFLESKFKSNDERFIRIESKTDEIKNSVIDIDKRLYAVETLLHMKDCCVLKQDQNLKKVE